MKTYRKEELKALGFPSSLVTKHSNCGDITVGTHHASGARIYAKVYSAWSLAHRYIRDQESLNKFVSLCEKRKFDLSTIPGLEEQIIKSAQDYALEYKGVKYEWPLSLEELLK